MVRFVIYLFPFLMDMSLGTMFFVCSLRMAESGASAFAVSMVCTVWALTYSLSALAAGRLIRPENAAAYVIGSCLAVSALSVMFVVFPVLWMQYVLMIGIGLAVALFFVPFQVFMKAVMGRTSWGLNVSTGLYTAAWSTGMALGPFVSGLLWQHFNWQICHLVNAVAALVGAIGTFTLRHYARRPVEEDEPVNAAEYAGYPDLVMVGWVCGAVCFLVVAMTRAVFPSLATALAVTKAHQGMVFAILFGMQGLTGLLLCPFKRWMYRRVPIILVSLSGLAGFVLFTCGHTASMFFLGALLIGIYTGAIGCYFVFHSLVHPSKSSGNVAINEAIVGITGIFGPVFGGIVADRAGLSTPFLIAAVLLGIVVLSYWQMYRRKFGRTVALSDYTR